MTNVKNIHQKVFITGANGFMGSALMRYYKALQINVIGLDVVGNDSDIIAGNLLDIDSWKHHLQGVDVIIHTAAIVSNGVSDNEMWQVNVFGTKLLLDAAIEKNVKRFVQISSIVAYGNEVKGEVNEDTPVHCAGGSYVLTKIASEHTVLNADTQGKIEVVIVRPGDLYGPASGAWILKPLAMIKSNLFMLPAKGNGYFRPTFIDDLVEGVVLAAAVDEAKGQIFNLSCKDYITTKEFFSYHYKWLNKKGPLVLPTSTILFFSKITTFIYKIVGKEYEGTPASVHQLATQVWFNIDKAERILGWQPKTNLRDGMEITKQWLIEKGLLK